MPETKLNLKEIIEMAVQIEVTGAAFYKRLKELSENTELRKLYRRLEMDEQAHIKDFEAILRSADSRRPGIHYSTTDQDLLYLRAFAARRIFSDTQDAISKAESLTDPARGVEMAIDFELDTIAFFREMADVIEDPEDRTSVQELERQEKEHATQLYRVRQEMGNGNSP